MLKLQSVHNQSNGSQGSPSVYPFPVVGKPGILSLEGSVLESLGITHKRKTAVGDSDGPTIFRWHSALPAFFACRTERKVKCRASLARLRHYGVRSNTISRLAFLLVIILSFCRFCFQSLFPFLALFRWISLLNSKLLCCHFPNLIGESSLAFILWSTSHRCFFET